MISAAVGFQCPVCVAEGNKGVRTARTTLGGRVSADATLVTRVLVGATVLVFLGQYVGGAAVTDRFALVGLRLAPGLGGDGLVGVADGDYYRLLTAAFLHGGVLHLLLNMYGLWLLGGVLEPALGRGRFLLLYVVSAVAGSAASYAFNPPPQYSVGASGAIFGLFGAMVLVGRRLNVNISALLVVLGINLAYGFLAVGIDWRAHLGGLAAGVVLGAAYAYAPRRVRAPVQVAAVVVVLVLVGLAVAARTAALGG
jgi:membrane associated rhomboid family serine protease